MACGILVDVHGPEIWDISSENIIGNLGKYYISDDQLHFEGEMCVRFMGDISYDNNDGYMQIVLGYNMIELVKLTAAEYDKLWDIQWSKPVPILPSWADYYKKHKNYLERLNEKAKWKIGDRVEISFVDPRAKSHLVGDDYKPLSFTKGCKGTVIRHSDGHHDGIDYLIEFDERIGNLSLEYGKNDHCFWMNKSKENGRLEKRLFMWDKPVLLECKSIKTDQIQMKNTQIFDENVEALYKMKSQEMAISNLLETIEIL